jgi:negative regulator of flagellin synthesis FlgM
MKIDGSTKPFQGGSVSSGTPRQGKGADAPASGAGGGQVQLSSLASQLQALESSMADTPVIDSARVAEIKQAISEGRFKINPDAVADQLLQTARELLRVQR